MSKADRLGRTLLEAVPVLVAALVLLSLATLWFARLMHDAPLMESEGVVGWQGEVELILAYANFGWIGLLTVAYFLARWRGWMTPTVLSLAGFVVNYAAWVVMVGIPI